MRRYVLLIAITNSVETLRQPHGSTRGHGTPRWSIWRLPPHRDAARACLIKLAPSIACHFFIPVQSITVNCDRLCLTNPQHILTPRGSTSISCNNAAFLESTPHPCLAICLQLKPLHAFMHAFPSFYKILHVNICSSTRLPTIARSIRNIDRIQVNQGTRKKERKKWGLHISIRTCLVTCASTWRVPCTSIVLG